MSLLNLLQSNDPAINNGLLNFGLSLLQSKGNFGNAVGRAGQVAQLGARDFRQQEELLKRAGVTDQLLQMQLEQAKQQQALQNLPAQFARTPQQQAMAANGGPTVAAANAIPNTPPGFDMPGYLQALTAAPGGGPLAAMRVQQAMQKEAPQPIISKPGEIARDASGKILWSNPDPAGKEPEAIRALKAIYGEGTPEYGAALKQYGQQMTTHQPGTSVSVNTGQRGLDNTLKLRGDFRGEPVYKAHQEMQSAYAQIQQSLKQASPAGDLAGATKIMKLLDPGSVVRESELGMAMAASGLLDRVQNYASMVMTGTKLTPTQRKDFQTLADALYGESVKQYNAKRAEYEGIANRNQLPVQDVLGAPSVAPPSKNNWSIVKVP